jgi:hypothetical protein
MIVDGKDHDLLMLAYTFCLYGNDDAERTAYEDACRKDPAGPDLDAMNLLARIAAAGYNCLFEGDDPDIAYAVAERGWRTGCPVLVRVLEPSHCDTPRWHLYLGQHDGHMLTLCQDARADRPRHGEPAYKVLCGEAITILEPIRYELVALQQRLLG